MALSGLLALLFLFVVERTLLSVMAYHFELACQCMGIVDAIRASVVSRIPLSSDSCLRTDAVALDSLIRA